MSSDKLILVVHDCRDDSLRLPLGDLMLYERDGAASTAEVCRKTLTVDESVTVYRPDSMPRVGVLPAAPKAGVTPWLDPRPIAEAPKDRPILAWCDHEADPYVADEAAGRLTLYGAASEVNGHAPTGWHIVEWGGAWCDTGEYGVVEAEMPDWWYVVGSEFESAANPICFYEMPPPKKEPKP